MPIKNRKKTEEFILKYIAKLTPGTNNADTYKKMFASMSDKDFDKFMNDLKSGELDLSIIMSNFNDRGITVKNNLNIAKELGHNFFEKLWIEGTGDDPTYLTPVKYLVVDLPFKRAAQMLVKKMSIPETSKVVDYLTGQPTGISKGARISYPEVQLCASMGLTDTMVELMKYRGGDEQGRLAMNRMINSLGEARQDVLEKFSSGVKSTRLLSILLKGMHLNNTL